MPLHNWSKVESGYYHSFHQQWISSIAAVLNTGILPDAYMAISERNNERRVPDVLTLKWDFGPPSSTSEGGVATKVRPQTTIVQESDEDIYADLADRVVVQESSGQIVAILELVSPGNKHSWGNFEDFLKKTTNYIRSAVSVMVIDPFAPTPRDPQGIHAAIWERLGYTPQPLPPGKDRAVISYDAGERVRAYVEPIAVGDVLPDMPLYLGSSEGVMLPLQATYDATWNVYPKPIKRRLE